jgi:hypothetical protein
MAQNPTGSNPRPEKQNEPMVSMGLQNARLSDAVELLGAKYKINIVADAYLDDHIVPSLSVKEVPLSATIKNIASLFRRDAIQVNGVIVLRHRQWYLRSQSEQEYARQFRANWNDDGIVSVERVDPLPSPGKPVKKTASTAKSGMEYPTWLPPRFNHASVKNAALRSFMGKFASCTGWEVSYENRIATRRINAKLHHVTPGQTLEALSVLFNTTQRVSLVQGKELKQLEAALSETAMDT